jgi:glycosyltransferase involved in cell wall biosynthesis
MKVAFYVYPTAFQNPGGGEVQLLKTKEYLEKLGVSVKLFDTWCDKLETFDILHTFGSVKDAFPMMEAARRAGIKNVLSTICWYNWRSAWETPGSWAARAAALGRHAGKVFLPFVPSQRKRMMEISDVLMPNSESEAEQLERFFRIPRSKIAVVPNAVDAVFADVKPDLFIEKYNLRDFVLCVGRIEPRKNQLGMIRALTGTKVPFVLIGDPVKTYPAYYQACRKAAGGNVHFLGGIPHESELLKSAYAACDTFLLASWLETPGLAALEAGLAGAKIVITREGATREYFAGFASYVDPSDHADIRSKILMVHKLSKETRLKEHISRNYSWDSAARKIFEIYKKITSHS